MGTEKNTFFSSHSRVELHKFIQIFDDVRDSLANIREWDKVTFGLFRFDFDGYIAVVSFASRATENLFLKHCQTRSWSRLIGGPIN